GGPHLEEQRAEQTCERKRGGEADGDARNSQQQRPPQDEPHYQGAGSAEGQANADFLRLLRHGISHDAVNADAGQHQSYAGEDSKQYHPQALTQVESFTQLDIGRTWNTGTPGT